MAMHIYKGTPLDLGHEIFGNHCLPVIEAASKQPGVDATAMAHLYAGFLQSCMGSLAADFGHQQAIQLVEMMVEEFKRARLDASSEAPAPTTH